MTSVTVSILQITLNVLSSHLIHETVWPRIIKSSLFIERARKREFEAYDGFLYLFMWFTKMFYSNNLSGLVSAQIVRLLKSGAFCMTRFIALSPVGSPTSDTMTIMLLVFFSMYSKTKSWVTRFMRRSSLAKWAPGRSTKVRVVNSGPGEEERARSRTSIKLNEEFARLAGKKGPLNDFDMWNLNSS